MNTALGLLILGIAAMPFVALLSLLTMFVAVSLRGAIQRSRPRYRLRAEVRALMKRVDLLLWIILAEFVALTLVHTLWPRALNWW